MVPLGPLAFIHPTWQINLLFCIIWDVKHLWKRQIEEASKRNSQKIADLEEQIQQLTNNLNRIKLEINQINQEGNSNS